MHVRTKGRLAGLAFILVSSLTATAEPLPVVTPSPVSGAVNPEATATLDLFLLHALKDDAESGVKVEFQSVSGHREVLWVTSLVRTDVGLVGWVSHAVPAIGLQADAPVTIPKSAIRDWYVTAQDGRSYGAFTTRAAMDDLPAAYAAMVTETLMPNPIPDTW